jgi:RNA polymerase sigma factor (sigma-70 family)
MYYPLSEDREDLFQEIVLQLWKSYPTFQGNSKVSTWIYRVALNTIFTRKRREKILPVRELLSDEFQEIPDPVDEHQAYLEESTKALYEAIQKLSETDKAVILLYLDEHSYEEISTILEMSKTNVSTRINRIKIKLEKLLKPHML